MMYENVIRPQKTIEDLVDECMENEAEGRSKYPGMTYEQGIQAAINWLTQENADHPLED